MGICYRLWQFLTSVRALLGPVDDTPARHLLTPTEYALFRRMTRYDRNHALRVFRQLQEQGPDDPLLQKAALLHDVGKSAGRERIPLLYRGLIVVARRFPRCWARLAQPWPSRDPRRPFYLHATHAARGAELARLAGTSEQVADLIAAHHDEHPAGLARLLQEADRTS